MTGCEEALGYCLYAHHRSCGSCSSTAKTHRRQRHPGLGLASPQFSNGMPLSECIGYPKAIYGAPTQKTSVKNNESPSDRAFVSPAEKLSDWQCTWLLRSRNAFR